MSTPMTMTNCPSEETLAAFIDGRLDPEPRRRVVEHMSSCADCYDVVSMAWDLQATDPALAAAAPVVRGRFGSRTVWASAAAALAAAAVVSFVFLYAPLHDRLFPPKTGIEALVAASEGLQYRPTRARMSGAFPYRPVKPVQRGGGREDSVALLAIAAQAEKAWREQPTADNARAFAMANLALGKWQEAVTLLEEGIRRKSGKNELHAAIDSADDAGMLSDLAAAYYARAEHTQNAGDYVRALDASLKAAEHGSSPEIVWNTAVALEVVGSTEDAAEAWKNYLTMDPASPWSVEARARLARLQSGPPSVDASDVPRRIEAAFEAADHAALTNLSRDFPTEASHYAEDVFLERWARSSESPQQHATLSMIDSVAAGISKGTGDQFLADSVEAIRRCSGNKCGAAAAGHSLYAEGRRMSKNRPREAVTQYRRAVAAFDEAGSPFAELARLRLAGCLYRTTAYADAMTELERLPPRSVLMELHYTSLVAQAGWVLGITHMELGEPDAAMRAYLQTIPLCVSLQDSTGEAAMRSYAAQAASQLGDYANAWTHRLEAIRIDRETRLPLDRRHVLLTEMGLALTAEKFPRAASVVFDRLVKLDRESPVLSNLCTALLWRSRHQTAQGKTAEAVNDFNEANQECARIEDPAVLERVMENVDLVSSELESDESLRSDALSRAIAFAEHSGSRFRLATLYTARSREYLRARQFDLACRDSRAALLLLENETRAIGSEEFRASFLNIARATVAAAMAAQLSIGNPARAFDAVEWLHDVSSLSPWRDGREAKTYSTRELQDMLPSDVAVVTYFLHHTDLTVFMITADRIESFVLVVPDDFSLLPGAFVEAIVRKDRADSIRIGQLLGLKLLDPVSRSLTAKTTVVIIPDGDLSRIPFGALPLNGQYLVEQFCVTTAPSISLVLRTRQRSRKLPSGIALIVSGAPRVPSLDTLSYLDEETEEIASLYQGAARISSVENAGTFLRSVAASATCHYAGHALVNEERPMFSSLALQGSDPDQVTYVYAHQIARHNMTACRVVLLSGCGTARGRGQRSSSTLAQAFMMAGVPAVVGALWDVSDSDARMVFGRIHRRLAEGQTPLQAVHNTQLELLRSPTALSAPSTWASISILGGLYGDD